MKAKELFKKVEATNFINREMWGVRRQFGLQVHIQTKVIPNYEWDPKALDEDFAFATWDEFVYVALDTLNPEILHLIGHEELYKKDWDYIITTDKWLITFVLWEKGL